MAAPAAAQGVFDMGSLTNTLSIPTRAGRSAPPPPAFAPAGPALGAIGGAFEGRRYADTGPLRLDYRPTTALKREALGGYVKRISRENPEAARQVATQFARHDAGRIYQGMARPFGLRDDDTGDILTAYTVLGWLIATGASAPSPGSVQAARDQIAAGLAASPQLSGPRTRAALGEELKLLFVTLHAGWQSARREGNVQAYSDGVARMFRQQSGRDLRNVRLTRAGFSRR